MTKTSSGTKRIWAMSPGVRKLSAPITMPEIGAALTLGARPRVPVLMYAVAGEVQDAPAVLVNRLHDRRCRLVYAIGDVVIGSGKLFGDEPRFLARAGQVGEIRRAGEIGVADDQRGIARRHAPAADESRWCGIAG